MRNDACSVNTIHNDILGERGTLHPSTDGLKGDRCGRDARAPNWGPADLVQVRLTAGGSSGGLGRLLRG